MRAAWLALLVALPASSFAQPEGLRYLDTLDAEGAREPLRGWTGKPLSAADVDDDGDLDLLAQDANARVYVLDPTSGRVLVENETRHPYGPDLGPFNGVRAADLDGDGVVELVAVNRAAVVTLWHLERDGDALRAAFAWDRHLDDLHERPSADAGPALGDLDRDGTLEIVAQTEERGIYALRIDGSSLWTLDEYGGNAEPWVGDVDGDEDLDVVVWTDGGVVAAVEGATGERLWRFDVRERGVWPGSVSGRGLVEDLDGDGRREVVSCARDLENATPTYAPGRPRYAQHDFALFLLREGALAWLRQPSWGNPLCSAYLMAHDLDGDGVREIVGMDWNTIGHKPGDWERLGPAHVFAYDVEGRERWHASVDTFNAKFPIVLADVMGDHAQEVVAYDDDALVVLDARDGRLLRRMSLGDRTVTQGLLVADVFGDGRQILVVPVEGDRSAVLLFDAGAGRAVPAFGGIVSVPRVDPRPLTPSPAVMPSATPTAADPPAARVEPATDERSQMPGADLALVASACALAALTRTRRRAPS